MQKIKYFTTENMSIFKNPESKWGFLKKFSLSANSLGEFLFLPKGPLVEGEVVGVASRPLSEKQKNILEKYVPIQSVKNGQPMVFDVDDISDKWSIDFLSKLDIPARVLFIRKDQWHRIDKEDYFKQALPIRPSIHDVWEYALEAKQYFQYVILVTEMCNFRCIQCPFHSEDDAWVFKKMRPKEAKTTHLRLDLLYRFLEDVPKKSSIRLGANGEPFLHPQIFPILERLKKDGHEVVIQTNGNLLDSEKLRRLIDLGIDQLNFGIEGITSEHYAAIRQGGTLAKVLGVMDECMELKRRGMARWLITINYSLLPNLSGNINEVSGFFRGHADRINFSKAFVDPCCEHTFDEGDTKRVTDLPGYCFTLLHGPVLGPTGLVFPCGLMSNAEWFVNMPWLKHIGDASLPEILEEYKTMIRDLSSDFRKICKRCTFWAHAYREKGTFTDAYYYTEFL